MNMKNEANAIQIELKKLESAWGLIVEDRARFPAPAIDLHTDIGRMVRDHDVMFGQMLIGLMQIGASVRDVILELDERTQPSTNE